MRVTSRQRGNAVQFTGGRQSAQEIGNLVGQLGKIRHRPGRTGNSPAIPASPESVIIVSATRPKNGVGQTKTLAVGDWVVKTELDEVQTYTDDGFRQFWEPSTIVDEEIPVDAYQEPHKALDPEENSNADEDPDEAEGGEEGADTIDQRDLVPADPGDLLQDPERPVDLADEVGEPGEVGRPE